MSTVTTNRQVDISGLGFEASSRWDGATCTVVAAGVGQAALQAAVDAAPTFDLAARQARATDRAARMAQVRAKARDVMAGTATWTATERDRILAALVLDRLAD